jgi:uncharacterized repeat protein (TIGR02543 family)
MNKQVSEFHFLKMVSLILLFLCSFYISCSLTNDIDQTCTVTFDGNSGIPEVRQQTVNNGGKAIKPSDPEKIGCTFSGWYKEPDCINEWDFSNDTVISNITLYAKWSINNYIVVYDANGGEGSMETSYFTYGISQNLRPNTFVWENYVFSGWARTANGFL